MAGVTNFPTGLDSFGDEQYGDSISALEMNNIRRAFEAVETKIGVDNSAVVTTVDYLLKHASSLNPGHKHTLAQSAVDVTATAAEVNRMADLSANNFFGTGRAVYFYSNTVPTGWTYAGSVTDRVLAVKGGTQAYNVNGGNQAGSWQQPDHILTKPELPKHKHHYDKSYTYSDYWRQFGTGMGANVGYTSIDTENGALDGLANGAHYHGTIYRPYGAVGIIGTKDA